MVTSLWAAIIEKVYAGLARQHVGTAPVLRQLRRRASKQLRAADGPTVVRAAERLITTRYPRGFAYEIVHHHAGAVARLSAASLNRLG
jgi:hypothetical protein